MHPLTLWLTSIAELGEREREREVIRRRHESDPVPVTPLERDGRWAAAMHRWAERSEAQAQAAAQQVAPPSTEPAAAPAPASALPRLGCA